MPDQKTLWGFLKDLLAWRKPYDESRHQSEKPQPKEAIRRIAVIIFPMCCLFLSGCAGYQQAMNGYEAAALKGIQAAEDNNISMWRVNACGTPLSAIMRHPDIVPALKMLCLPGGDLDNPAILMEDIKK